MAYAIFLAPHAFAATEVVHCPTWDSIHSAPEPAGYARMRSYALPQCIGTVSCVVPSGFNGIHADCTAPNLCGPNNHFVIPYGSGPSPDIREVNYAGGYWCGQYTDDQKNKGDPDECPKCGKGAGNPVNVATGNKFQREPDFSGTAQGTLSFVRYYNSAPPWTQHRVGHRWSHTYSRSLFRAATQFKATRADGKVITFRQSGTDWVTDADTPDRLVALGAGWQLTTANNEVEVYSATGRLISITDAAGRVTSLSYSDGTASGPNGGVYEDTSTAMIAGFLIRVQDFTGRQLQFGYTSNGLLRRLTDALGGAHLYNYDTSVTGGKLTSVQYPNSTTRTYHYNESANTSGANLPFALTGITDENGTRFATYKYASDGRALSTEHAGVTNKYSIATYGASTTTYTDPLGATFTASHTTIQGMKQVTGTSRTCTGCGTTSETYTFDADRNRTSHKDFNGNLTCYAFGPRNLETSRTEGLSGTGTCASRVTTPATRTLTTEWHPTWRLQKRTAEPLKITTYSYHGETGVSCAPSGASTMLLCSKTVQATTDADGSLAFAATNDGAARTWAYTYNLEGQVLTASGPRTDVTDETTLTYYTSDDVAGKYRKGDLATSTNALGHVTQFTEYDAAGRLLKSIDANGLETILEYWPRGWLKTRKAGSAAAGYEITSYEYDSLGQLAKVTQPDASFVQYTYDAAHRLTEVADGLGNRIHYTLDAIGNRTLEESFDPSNTLMRAHSRVIDGLNRVWKDVGGTTPSTQVTQNTFDANGNITAILDPLSRTTNQEFDALNRVKAVKDPFNGTANPTSYTYNRQGVLTQVTDPTGLATTYTVNGHGETTAQSSPDTGSTSFTFDAASNMLTKVDARSIQATYAYDALNRVTQIVYPDETVTYTWDSCTNGKGRLCSISDVSGTTTYTLDLWGRVTGKSQNVASLTQSMGYAFNSAGQLATVTTPSGRQVVYTYANGRPVSVTVGGVSVVSGVVYEPFGPNGGWTWGNSSPGTPNTHTRIHDKDYRTTRVTSDLPVSGSQPYFDKQFTWDHQSRITSIADLANSALNASYGFDSLDRVTSATQGAASWGYTFNGIGDRLTSTLGAASTTYGYQSGTHRLTSLAGAQSKSYTYDVVGNMTSDGTTTWVYGGSNRPTSAGTTAFLINALGQRVKKTTGSSATRFVYDEAGRLWGEYDAAGTLIQEVVWLDDLPVAVLRDNGSGGTNVFYIHPDHLGTPRAITRASDNQFVWKWDNTEAFGNSAPDENPSGLGAFAFNHRFPGQYFDSETGKYYNYFRDYDPAIGRYVESDPVGLRGGFNTYLYVGANPIRDVDPLGLKPWNGNFTPGFSPQKPNCDLVGDFPLNFNKNECARQCCGEHDRCYADFRCNSSSWGCNILTSSSIFGVVGAAAQLACRSKPSCSVCNATAFKCIVSGFAFGCKKPGC